MSTESQTSRRNFLGALARGSMGIAALPSLGLVTSEAWAEPPLPSRPEGGVPDEAYWREVKARFDLRPGVTPMNAANLCPAPRAVVETARRAQQDIDGDVSFQNRAKYGKLTEEVREKVARYLNVSPDEIAIVRNTSEANNIVVGGLALQAGDEVVLLDQNHPTNNVAWDVRAARFGFVVRRVKLAETPASSAEVMDAFRQAITPRTRVLAFSDVSNSTGLRLPTRELCHFARERGIYTHVDGAQTLGALHRDLRELGCDSYASSAHKWLMGPKEAGVLFVRSERIPQLWPGIIGVGWGDAAETSARGARKFETLGQRNDATVAALGTAIDFHEQIGPRRVEDRVIELAAALKRGLSQIHGSSMITSMRPDLSAGVVVVQFRGVDSQKLYSRLYEEHGIAAAPTGGLRFSPHVYNTLEDIESAVAAVRALHSSLS